MLALEWVEIPEGKFVYGLTAEQKADIRSRMWREFGIGELDSRTRDHILSLQEKYRRRTREKGTYNLLKDWTPEESTLVNEFIHNGFNLIDFLDTDGHLEGVPEAREIWLPTYHIMKYPLTIDQAHELRATYLNRQMSRVPGTAAEPEFLMLESAIELAGLIGGRIPTPEEWEKAARGTDGRLYPWGNEWDSDRGNFGGRLPAHIPRLDRYLWTPVNAYPNGVSPYGVWDMAGNVAEYVQFDGEGDRVRGLGLKDNFPPYWYWALTSTTRHGGLHVTLRAVRES